MDEAVKKFTDFTDLTYLPRKDMKVHIFRVKPTDEAVMKLLETGFFDGTEKFIRKTSTKGSRGEWIFHVYTVIYNDGRSYSWECGSSGHTCVSEKTRRQEMIIDRAIDLLVN